MNDKFPQLFWGMLMLAIAIVFASMSFSGALVKVKRVDDSLSVTGSAKKQITSDYVVWYASVSRKSDNMASAYSATRKDMETVVKFLKEKGIKDEEIELNPVSSSEQSWTETFADGSETVHWYWIMTQSFEIRSNDVDGITNLSRDITDLIASGVSLQSNPPQYYYSKIADLRIEMLGLATKDARERAAAIVEGAGGRLGPLTAARMGVFQITVPNSTEVDDYGIYDTSSIDKDITAVVRLTFAVE